MKYILKPKDWHGDLLANCIMHCLTTTLVNAITKQGVYDTYEIDVGMTINGIEVNVVDFFTALEKQCDKTVAEEATEMIEQITTDKINRITELIDDLEIELSDCVRDLQIKQRAEYEKLNHQ